MSIEEYSPSEIEIQSLGIGVINSEYLDLTTREYLVVGDISEENELGLNIGELQTTTMTDIHKRNIKYSMIVNNAGIGLNTSRKKFDENFKDKNVYGIYIEKGDIFCDGTIMAKNIKLMNDDGTPYVFDITNPEQIIQNLIESINSNSELSRFTQGWNSTIVTIGETISKNNIFTESFVNINAGSTDTINNLHPLNIVSGPLTDKIEGIQLAIKNTALTQPYRYIEDDEIIQVREPSSIKFGIMGNSNISPAIISTTKDMPLEFHVSKFNQEINNLYKYNGNTVPIYDTSNYPSMVITKNGNIAMGKDYVENIITDIEPKLHVYGNTLLDNIYVKDNYDNKKIKHLDDLFIRKLGLNFNPNQIIPGAFNSGEYEFDNLIIHNNLETNNLVVRDNIQFDKILNIEDISISKLNIRETADLSVIRSPMQFYNQITISNDIVIENSGGLKINDHRVSALAIRNIKTLVNNADGTFTTIDGTSLTAEDIADKIALYYALDSNSGFIIDNSNLSIYGNIGIGIQNEQTYGNNKITINNDEVDRDNYEIGIYNQGDLISSIGHYKTSFGENDNSLIIKTENPGSTNMMNNIYFYAGKTNDNIRNGYNGETILPTLAILQNQSIGINTNEILDIENIKLNVNGYLLTDDIYIRKEGNIAKALFFVKNNVNEISNVSPYTINNQGNNNKFFINYNESDISRINFIEKNKTFNIKGGINITTTNTINDGYFENNIKLSTFKLLKNTSDIDVKTAYTNNNILIGLEDLSINSKNEYINTTISKPQLMLRNLSERDYNDTIIRLYKGKSNGDISNQNNKAKYSGIDFCDWEPITGLKDKERWYIYRNYDTTKQTIKNYPGVFEIGYADNQYHPTKSGLEMMYKRNNTNIAIRNEDIKETDTQNYYFIFNRPVNDSTNKLPTYEELNQHPTIKVYGDVDIVGEISCSNLKILNQSITVVNNTLDNPNQIITQSDSHIVHSDITITADKLINKTNSIININNQNELNLNNFDKFNTNNLFYYNNDKSILSFVKEYNHNDNISIDFSTIFKYDTDNYSIVNKIKLSIEPMGELINSKEAIKVVNPSCLSIKNNLDNKLISFYNDENYSYINIGNNAINNSTDIENIALHIQDTSKYLLQLTNTISDISPKINFQNKISDTNNDFWILDGPDNNKKFNIIYGNNADTTNQVDNLYNVMTFTHDKKIGINNTFPIYSLDVLSENYSSCRLINDYSNDTRNNFDNETDFTIVNVNNSNLNFDTSFNINDNSISFNLDININSSDIPDYTINQNYIYEDIKNNSDYIKTNILYHNNDIEIPITFPNEILDYTINYHNIDLNIFEVTSEVTYNEITKNLELYNKLLLPSLANNNDSNYEFKVNHNFIDTKEFQSNIFTNSFDSFNNILINNEYNIINTSDKQFSSNITNYNIEYDNLLLTSNIHVEFTNYLYSDDKDNATEELYKINLINKIIDDDNYKIYFSNIIKYEANLSSDSVDVDLIVKEKYNNDVTLKIPYTITNLDNIIYNNLYDYNINPDNSYTFNFVTCNYLLNNIFGGSIDNISTNTIEHNIINDNKQINFEYIFNSQNYQIDKNVDIEFKFNYEKYDENIQTHYLYTNTIENVPHIILQNTLNSSNSIIDGTNKIYSTLDGDFKINFETNDNQEKTLLNINKNGNVHIDNGNLYVDKIFVDNIYNKHTLNSIILDNTNNFNEDIYVNSFSNLNIEASSNIELKSSQINLNVYNNNNSNIKIIKTGDNNGTNNKILEIFCNDEIDSKLYNALALSKINTTTYLRIGENSAKIGICKNIDEIESTFDINGNMQISKNNFDSKVPHITLNNYNQNVIYKKYNENLIYSDDGTFKLTLKNSITQSEKELFKINNNDMNINSDNLLIKNIYVENIYDNFGNALVLGNNNYNNYDFFNFTHDLNLEASNIKFTTSNIDISLRENSGNYFNINKIRNRKLGDVLDENYQETNFVTFEDTSITSHHYSSLFLDKTANIFYIYNTNKKLAKYDNVTISNFHEFSNFISKFKFFENNYNKLGLIKNNSINIFELSSKQETQLSFKLPSDYTDNYPTYTETIKTNITIGDTTVSQYNIYVTVTNGNYYFNNSSSKLFLGIGKYHFNNIPITHPIGFVIDDISKFEVSGTIFSGDSTVIDEITMVYYIGDIIVEVKEDFGEISYVCYNHGYMGGENNIAYQEFNLIIANDLLIDSSQNVYIADGNNILKISLSETVSNNTYTTYFISKNDYGNEDGILNLNAKIGLITSIVYDNINTIYLSDYTNFSIRKINITDNTLITISGYLPTISNNIPRSGNSIGNSYDTRYNSIKKILLINNNEFLLVLDSSSFNSRIVIIDLEFNYSSLLYNIDNVEIYDIEYHNNSIYYIDEINTNIVKKIEITDITKYKKDNINTLLFNNIFSITSIPYDSVGVNSDFYSRSKYDYSDIDGFITNMSIKNKDELTYVQFGSNINGKHACIGISTEPEDNIDLKVNNKIQTYDLEVLNTLTVESIDIANIVTNYIDSYQPYIEIKKHFYPTNDTINFGSESDYFNNLFIKNITISENLTSGLVINSTGLDLFIKIKNNTLQYGNIHVNKLQLYDEESETKSIINYNNSNLEFNFYNINSPDIQHSFIYDINEERLLLNNLTVNGEFILESDFTNNNIYTSNIITEDTITTFNINSYNINVSNILTTSNITCYSNLIVNNDINVNNNIITSNDIYVNSNLYVYDYSFINNLDTSNINIINGESSNFIIHDTLYTSNLIVQGNQTIIETNHYETENLFINNTQADGPSLQITHNNTQNVLEFTINQNQFVLDKDCKLQLNDIKVNNNVIFDGSINNISSNNLNYILNLDKNIIEKFEDSSNYTQNVENIANNSSNIIKDVDHKLDEFIDQDFFKENPLHPIIKEFDSSGNIIDKYTYNNQNNSIFSTYDSSNFYIVLKNDTDNPQKHYQLSVTNNLLTDIMMVGGGGSGKNIDIDYQYDNSINELINTGDILGISLSNDYLYYFKKNVTNTIYYANLNDINDEHLLVNNIEGTITDFKISNNNKYLLYTINSELYINTIINFVVDKIDIIQCNTNITKVIINNLNNYIYVLVNNSSLIIIELQTLNVRSINLDFECIDIDISYNDNYLYMVSSDKINIFNIKTHTIILYKNFTNLYKTKNDKYHNFLVNIIYNNNKLEISKYSLDNDLTINIDFIQDSITSVPLYSNVKNSQYDIAYNSLVYYLKNNNLYSKPLFDDIYPSPGGAGGLLYRSDSAINQGVYDLYIGNGGTNNNNGYDTSGFGVTVYGGEKGKLNNINIPVSGDYKGYLVENDYIIKNNPYENIQYSSDIFNGGTSATNYFEDNYYNGRDGYNPKFLENDKDNLNLNEYFSGGSGIYPGFKGKGGGTNSRDTYKLIKKDLIADSNSGAGASGGYNRLSSIYPKINDSYINAESTIINIDSYNGLTELDIIFELPTTVKIIIYNNYVPVFNDKYLELNDILLNGEYHILINYDSNNDKYYISFKNKNDGTILYEYLQGIVDNNTYTNLSSQYSELSSSQHIAIKLNNIIYENTESYQVTNDKISYNDISKGGSGIIVMKYNIYKDPISDLQTKFDNRLKLLEENLLFSRINTYDDENIKIKFIKPDNQTILYDDLYIDQSYSGIKIISTKEQLNNTVNIKYKYIINIHIYILENYNDLIPNIISKLYRYETNNETINFNDFISYSGQFVYIDKINIEIYDNVYNFNNKSYFSNLIINSSLITPTINSLMPINNDLIVKDDNLTYNNNYQLISITDYSKYHILWSSKNTLDKLPLNVFNNLEIYGEWKTNTYLNTGILSETDGKQISVSATEDHFGEWILIKLDRKIQLNKINIDIGEQGTTITNFKIFAKNINDNDNSSIVDSSIMTTFFNNLEYTFNQNDNIYNINIINSAYYNTIVILFQEIQTNINTLKIKNINFEGIYKNWKI